MIYFQSIISSFTLREVKSHLFAISSSVALQQKMFGIRLLNRSAIASTSTSIACASNTTRWSSQRHFSLTRSLKEEKSNETTSSSQSSTNTNNEAESASLKWRNVGQLAQSTTTEGIRARPELNDRNVALWRNALRSVSAPQSHTPLSSHSLAQAAKRRTQFEEMEHEWQTRKVQGPERNALPSDGRSVTVINHDLGRAMSNLNNIFRVNNIRNELRLGERYEKPNQKRRRLASERHRRRFAHMVREKVQLVSEGIRNRSLKELELTFPPFHNFQIMYLKSRGA